MTSVIGVKRRTFYDSKIVNFPSIEMLRLHGWESFYWTVLLRIDTLMDQLNLGKNDCSTRKVIILQKKTSTLIIIVIMSVLQFNVFRALERINQECSK